MSAVAIIRALLVAHAPVTALVPADRIRIGVLPQGLALPAIGISSIGGGEIGTIARRHAYTTVRERVQVTVYATGAAAYAAVERILLACKLGPGVHTGEVAGFYVNAVVPMGTNPDIPPGDDGIFERSRDFMVTFSEAN